MKVFLLKDVKGVGKLFETVEVKNGYASFLIREKIALDAVRAEKEVNDILKKITKEDADKEAEANNKLNILSGVKLTFNRGLTPKGTLDKVVTKQEISQALPISIDKKDLIIENNLDKISVSGTYKISIKVGCGKVAFGVVEVVA